MPKTDELTELDVAARLAAALIDPGQRAVAAATGKPIPALLAMVELRIPFSRAVLRYLGVRRIVTYRPAPELVSAQ